MAKRLYMAVTADEIEQPIYVTETVQELSKLTGVSESVIYTSISKQLSGEKNHVRFRKVVIDE